MSLEVGLAAFFAICGAVIGLWMTAQNAAKDKQRLSEAEARIKADEAARKMIQKARYNAEAANPDTPADAVITHGMSDDEFKAVFGYPRPHGNS